MTHNVAILVVLVVVAKHGTAFPRASRVDTNADQNLGIGPDKVEHFMKTIVIDIPAVLRFMEAIGHLRWMQVPKEEVELNSNKYAVADKIPVKDGGNIEPIGYIAAGLNGLLEKESVQNQELSQFFGALPNYQLLTYIRDMAVGAKVSDMVQLALQSTSLQKILQQAVKSMPVFKEIITDIGNKNLQDRVLIDVLMGRMPFTTDFSAITNNQLHYSLNALINAMKENKHFQEILAKTLDTTIDVHEGLKLLTGHNLHLSGDPNHNGKYTVTSLDLAQNNFLAQYGTTFLFLLENFSKIVKIIDDFDTASPDPVKIVGLVLGLDTSMLEAAHKGPLPQLQPQISRPLHVNGPQLVHTAVVGTSHMV